MYGRLRFTIELFPEEFKIIVNRKLHAQNVSTYIINLLTIPPFLQSLQTEFKNAGLIVI